MRLRARLNCHWHRGTTIFFSGYAIRIYIRCNIRTQAYPSLYSYSFIKYAYECDDRISIYVRFVFTPAQFLKKDSSNKKKVKKKRKETFSESRRDLSRTLWDSWLLSPPQVESGSVSHSLRLPTSESATSRVVELKPNRPIHPHTKRPTWAQLNPTTWLCENLYVAHSHCPPLPSPRPMYPVALGRVSSSSSSSFLFAYFSVGGECF